MVGNAYFRHHEICMLGSKLPVRLYDIIQMVKDCKLSILRYGTCGQNAHFRHYKICLLESKLSVSLYKIIQMVEDCKLSILR